MCKALLLIFIYYSVLLIWYTDGIKFFARSKHYISTRVIAVFSIIINVTCPQSAESPIISYAIGKTRNYQS